MLSAIPASAFAAEKAGQTPVPLPSRQPAPTANATEGATVARAGDAPPQRDKPALDVAPHDDKSLTPGHVDARITADTDILLAFMAGGASADVGVARLGPGTLTLGVQGEYAFCGSVCWFLNTVTPLEFSQHQVSLAARASYHLPIGKKVDLYPFASAGPTFATSTVRIDDGSAEYRGKDTAIALGAGAGVSYFLTDFIFIGAEGRLRYARGTYSYELVAGNEQQYRWDGNVQTWSLTGLDFSGALGIRF